MLNVKASVPVFQGCHANSSSRKKLTGARRPTCAKGLAPWRV
ncbi:mCG61770 [Mus musculus]|nr:mCG61770 [Mus musculus]